MNLDKWNFSSLMLFLPENKSLITLNLSRKKLNDKHGKDIAGMLKKNKRLRRLELEGNEFGPKTAKLLAEALEVNKSLKYLDLENNNLTNQGEDSEGVVALCLALKENSALISLNMSNNYLTYLCGQTMVNCLHKNKTLIYLEIFDNQRFEQWDRDNEKHKFKSENDSKFVIEGLGIKEAEEIKELVRKNKVNYDIMRKEELIERKKMVSEENNNKYHIIKVQSTKIDAGMKREDKQTLDDYYLENFNRYNEDLEKEFIHEIELHMINNKARLDKKKKMGK
jgi:hypothetical protein